MLLCYALLLQPKIKSLTTISTGNCQDLSSPSMEAGMGMAGTRLREAKTPEVWQSSCQVASSSDRGKNTPKKTWRQAPRLFPSELVLHEMGLEQEDE